MAVVQNNLSRKLSAWYKRCRRDRDLIGSRSHMTEWGYVGIPIRNKSPLLPHQSRPPAPLHPDTAQDYLFGQHRAVRVGLPLPVGSNSTSCTSYSPRRRTTEMYPVPTSFGAQACRAMVVLGRVRVAWELSPCLRVRSDDGAKQIRETYRQRVLDRRGRVAVSRLVRVYARKIIGTQETMWDGPGI